MAAGADLDDAVVDTKVLAEVAFDGVEDFGVIVDGENDGLGHSCVECGLEREAERGGRELTTVAEGGSQRRSRTAGANYGSELRERTAGANYGSELR